MDGERQNERGCGGRIVSAAQTGSLSAVHDTGWVRHRRRHLSGRQSVDQLLNLDIGIAPQRNSTAARFSYRMLFVLGHYLGDFLAVFTARVICLIAVVSARSLFA